MNYNRILIIELHYAQTIKTQKAIPAQNRFELLLIHAIAGERVVRREMRM